MSKTLCNMRVGKYFELLILVRESFGTYPKANTITANGVNIAGASYQCSRKGCQRKFKDVTISIPYNYIFTFYLFQRIKL